MTKQAAPRYACIQFFIRKGGKKQTKKTVVVPVCLPLLPWERVVGAVSEVP